MIAKRRFKKFLKNGRRLLPLVVGAVLLGSVLLVQPGSVSLNAYADQVVKKCANESYRNSCYDREIPKLMSQISMEDAFQVTALVQTKDPTYQYCHILGHELSAQEVRKDPSKWKEVVSRCPSGLCSNGCIHGGFQERFRADHLDDNQITAIKPDLETICEKRSNWNPTGLEQASCYHALGHLTMYMTSADTKKSLTLCNEIALKQDGRDYTQLCYDGVFMQIFQPLEPEDFALVHGKQPTAAQVPDFCGSYTGAQKGSCYSEAWPLFRDQIETPTGLTSYCAHEDADQIDRCYAALEYVVTAQFNFDQAKIQSFCSGLPSDRSGTCFANAASRLIETDYRNIDHSVAVCQAGSPYDPNADCFRELVRYSTYNFHAGSDEFKKLCTSLPEPWKSSCLAGGKS